MKKRTVEKVEYIIGVLEKEMNELRAELESIDKEFYDLMEKRKEKQKRLSMLYELTGEIEKTGAETHTESTSRGLISLKKFIPAGTETLKDSMPGNLTFKNGYIYIEGRGGYLPEDVFNLIVKKSPEFPNDIINYKAVKKYIMRNMCKDYAKSTLKEYIGALFSLLVRKGYLEKIDYKTYRRLVP